MRRGSGAPPFKGDPDYSTSSVRTLVDVALVSVTLAGSMAATRNSPTRPPTRTDLPLTIAEGRRGLKKRAWSFGAAGFAVATVAAATATGAAVVAECPTTVAATAGAGAGSALAST